MPSVAQVRVGSVRKTCQYPHHSKATAFRLSPPPKSLILQCFRFNSRYPNIRVGKGYGFMGFHPDISYKSVAFVCCSVEEEVTRLPPSLTSSS